MLRPRNFIFARNSRISGGAQADVLSWFKGNDLPPAPAGCDLQFNKPTAYQADLPLTPFDKVTGYNNEFGLNKSDPAANAGTLKTDPWQLRIEGEVAKPMTLDIQTLLHEAAYLPHALRRSLVDSHSVGRF